MVCALMIGEAILHVLVFGVFAAHGAHSGKTLLTQPTIWAQKVMWQSCLVDNHA